MVAFGDIVHQVLLQFGFTCTFHHEVVEIMDPHMGTNMGLQLVEWNRPISAQHERVQIWLVEMVTLKFWRQEMFTGKEMDTCHLRMATTLMANPVETEHRAAHNILC